LDEILDEIDTDGDGKVDFEEFEAFADLVEHRQKELDAKTGKRASTMIIIGRVKTGMNVKSVNLNELFQQFGGGGHAKAASATVRLEDAGEADVILQKVVDELIQTSLLEQPTVGGFMTAPVLSARPTMTETQVEDLFSRYDVRALPVVDDDNNVIGLVTYKEVAAAKQRLWNKEQKRLKRQQRETEEEERREQEEKESEGDNAEDGTATPTPDQNENSKTKRRSNDPNKNRNRNINMDADAEKTRRERRNSAGSALKGWMKQHVRVVEASTTLAEAEEMLLENDVGCIPVVADGTKQLVGMVTRTDILRQHRYYPSLHYHNKGFSDSIEARKPMIELRKRLKMFDLDNE
jgi:CBS domain-containing protein